MTNYWQSFNPETRLLSTNTPVWRLLQPAEQATVMMTDGAVRAPKCDVEIVMRAFAGQLPAVTLPSTMLVSFR